MGRKNVIYMLIRTAVTDERLEASQMLNQKAQSLGIVGDGLTAKTAGRCD